MSKKLNHWEYEFKYIDKNLGNKTRIKGSRKILKIYVIPNS